MRQVQTAGGGPAVLADLARLRSDMASLVVRLDEVKFQSASERDVQSLRVAVEQLSTRVAQGPDMRPLADMERRLGDISRQIEQRIDVLNERVGRTEGQ